MKIALVYDRVNKWGGAERVLIALKKIYKTAPLYTAVYNPASASWSRIFRVIPSFLNRIPKASKYNELLGTLMPISFESFTFDDYKVVISVTSEAAKGIITKPGTLHICYCLTPTRYLWSGYSDYFKNPYLRFVSKPLVDYLKKWDLSSSSRPDYYVAISKEVQRRIKKYYGIDSEVIYPPVSLNVDSNKIKKNKKEEKYFLVVSRLSKFVRYKRVDLAIEAFNKLGWNLKIIGTGSLESNLKRTANKNIEFLGRVGDEDLNYYYKNCEALIFPGVEDFGLVMVEAQSFGKPVIAFRGGGALEIVIEGKTGEFFNLQNSKSLIKVLKKFKTNRYNSRIIKNNAKRFSQERFEKEFRSFVNKRIEEYFEKA